MLFGLDVADVDGNKVADWQVAKAAGPIGFAIIRASQCMRPDSIFKTTWPRLAAAGLVRGAYMFLDFPRAGRARPAAPEEQAACFVETVGPLAKTDLPPTLDIEFPGGRVATGMSAAAALDWARAAWTVLRDAYRAPPIIYTSGRVWREELRDAAAPDLVESPLWLARYFWSARVPAVRDASAFENGKKCPPVPKPWGSAWAIHQHQGDAVKLPGFSATVDMNRFNTLANGSSGDFVKWVQRRLRVPETGMFDQKLTTTVARFQKRKKLVSDGVVGPRTFTALCWA